MSGVTKHVSRVYLVTYTLVGPGVEVLRGLLALRYLSLSIVSSALRLGELCNVRLLVATWVLVNCQISQKTRVTGHVLSDLI